MSEVLAYIIGERRICWPNPDATCLHGGCVHCDAHPFRTLDQIERYARKAGRLTHRGGGQADAYQAFQLGYNNDFFNVETRASKGDVTLFAGTVGVLALKAMADGIPGGTHGKKRDEILTWMLRHRRTMLDDAFRIQRQVTVP